jgi:hypothetical protein
MDMRKYGGETFIKVDSVRDKPLQRTIRLVKDGRFGPEVVFEENEIFGLNQTNIRTLIRAYGPNSDDWTGKIIRLELGSVMYQGTATDSVVVKPVSPALSPAKQAEAQAKAAAGNGKELNDDIPF